MSLMGKLTYHFKECDLTFDYEVGSEPLVFAAIDTVCRELLAQPMYVRQVSTNGLLLKRLRHTIPHRGPDGHLVVGMLEPRRKEGAKDNDE